MKPSSALRSNKLIYTVIRALFAGCLPGMALAFYAAAVTSGTSDSSSASRKILFSRGMAGILAELPALSTFGFGRRKLKYGTQRVFEKGKFMFRFAVVHCLLILVAMSVFPPAAQAIPTIQISFFANVFGVDQSEIVKKKQTGILTDDLWIANWVAKRSGVSPDPLLHSRRK